MFVKLPDGTYNPPPGSSAKLTKESDGSYTYETVNRAKLKFNAIAASIQGVAVCGPLGQRGGQCRLI